MRELPSTPVAARRPAPEASTTKETASPARTRQRGKGRKELRPSDFRTAEVTVRVTPAELAAVRSQAQILGLSISELIRRSVLGRRVKRVPVVNREAWGRLGLLAASLNQYVKAIQQGRVPDAPLPLLEQLRTAVTALREQLLGRES